MQPVEGALEAWRDPGHDESSGGFHSAVEIDGSKHGLECVGQDRVLVPAPCGLFAATEVDVAAESDRSSHLGERPLIHDRLAEIGERPLRAIGVTVVSEVGDHPAENGVAEELESLVALRRPVLGHPGAVTQRTPEQAEVVETMPKSLLKGGEVIRSGDHRGQEVARSCT